MTTQVKVPKEIQELFIEAAACRELAHHFASWLIPSPKALYYTIRCLKVEAIAWKTLETLFPAVKDAWVYDNKTGMAFEPATATMPVAPKKTRKPRTPKAVVAAPGEKA